MLNSVAFNRDVHEPRHRALVVPILRAEIYLPYSTRSYVLVVAHASTSGIGVSAALAESLGWEKVKGTEED